MVVVLRQYHDALTVLRRGILEALSDASDWDLCLNLYGLSSRLGLPRETIRGLVADMRSDGLVRYERGLWTEDGQPAGAGYSITEAGIALLATLV
jgi:hypothetical protein